MFGDKPWIKYLNPFGSKCYVHVPEEKQIRTSKLSFLGIKCLVIGYTESSKIVQLYDSQKCGVFTSRDVVFLESTKCLESAKIVSPTDLSLNLDSNTPWTRDKQCDLWE
jgi:hypothetical protein